MNDFGIPNTPPNRVLAATVASRVRADARALKATAAFWTLLGTGGLLLLAGIGCGAALFGYAYTTNAEHVAVDKLTTAISDALDKVTLKTDGSVRLVDNTVKLEPGGAVRLDTGSSSVRLDTRGGTVRLDASGVRLDTSGSSVRLDTSGSKVRLDTSGVVQPNIVQPTPQQLQPDARPQSNAKVVTDYTIFKEVNFGSGQIVTGWVYNSSEDTAPSSQFCYYFQASSSDPNTHIRYDIAHNRIMVPLFGSAPPIDVMQAFSNCVWSQQS